MLASLYLMSDATQNSARFGQLYSYLLVLNVFGLCCPARLDHQHTFTDRTCATGGGARLAPDGSSRIVFILWRWCPCRWSYYFSLQFLQR